MKTNNENGNTMIETTLYICMLIILGGVLATYAHKVMVRYKTGRTAQQVIDLKKAVLHFTAADEDYSNLSILNMDTNNSLPGDLRSGDPSRATHALGGEIKIGPAANAPLNDTSDNKYYMFFIQFKNLPHSSCVEILTEGQFYGDGSEMDTLIVNGKIAWQYPYSFYNLDKYDDNKPYSITKKPLNNSIGNISSIRPGIADAVEACSEEDNNDITWIFS